MLYYAYYSDLCVTSLVALGFWTRKHVDAFHCEFEAFNFRSCHSKQMFVTFFSFVAITSVEKFNLFFFGWKGLRHFYSVYVKAWLCSYRFVYGCIFSTEDLCAGKSMRILITSQQISKTTFTATLLYHRFLPRIASRMRINQGSGTCWAKGAMKPIYFWLYFCESHTIFFNT